MDANYLESMGRGLIFMAQSGRNVEAFSRWLAGDLKSAPAMDTLFSQYFTSLPAKMPVPSDSATGVSAPLDPVAATEAFRRAFTDFIKLCGVVSQQEHLELLKKYEKLKTRCREQEETITHLKALMNQSAGAGSQGVRLFENLIEQQTQQFEQFMQTVYGKSSG